MTEPVRDICERNHRFHWCAAIAFVLLVCLVFVDISYLMTARGVAEWCLAILFAVASIWFCGAMIHYAFCYLGERLNHRYLKRFREVRHLGAYQESRPSLFHAEGRSGHAVLLLHGFASSPQDFVTLRPYLEQVGLSYYAPNIEGFGNNTTRMLHHVRFQDWFRSALDAYDLLIQQYEKVSVVGHSLGSLIAMYVAEQRSVAHLVLSSPGVFPVTQDIKYKHMLQMPVLGAAFSWLMPIVPKPVRVGRNTTSDVLDDSVARNAFQYLAIPVNSLKQVFDAQDAVLEDLDCFSYTSLFVLYGKHELTVDVERFVRLLHVNGFEFKAAAFLQSAHSLLEDYDKAEVCFTIAKHLSQSNR